MSDTCVLRWIECHPGTAAWVQAVGAIVALAMAIAIPALQARAARLHAEKDRFARARSLLMIVYPELLALRAQVEAATTRLATPPPPGPYRQAVWLTQKIHVDVPRLLEGRLDNLYLFGDPAGLTLQQLLGVTLQFQDVAAKAVNAAMHDPNMTPGEVQAFFAGHLQLMKKLLDDLDPELKPFDVSPKVA